jgi:hypothetical protein
MCNNCDHWKIKRSFQRPSDFLDTATKLNQWLNNGKLINIGDKYDLTKVSNSSWPKKSISLNFQCPTCNCIYNLILDVDACRGGMDIVT